MAAFYCDTFKNHQQACSDQIVGILSKEYSQDYIDQKSEQTKTWIDSIRILKNCFLELIQTIPNVSEWIVLYEYKIPRRSKRIDVVILSEKLIFVLEFKIHQKYFSNADMAQLEDYCLDLRDFHFERSLTLSMMVSEKNVGREHASLGINWPPPSR